MYTWLHLGCIFETLFFSQSMLLSAKSFWLGYTCTITAHLVALCGALYKPLIRILSIVVQNLLFLTLLRRVI